MKRRKLILTLVVIILGLSTLLVMYAEKKSEERGVLKIISDKADLYVREFHYAEVGDPQSTWEIDADSAQYVKRRNLALLKNVRVKLTTADGTVYVMKGKEGRFYTDTKDMDVSGDVEIISDNGDRFRTDHLNYSDSKKRVSTESAVIIDNPQIKISGVGLFLFLHEKRATLVSDVKAYVTDFSMTR